MSENNRKLRTFLNRNKKNKGDKEVLIALGKLQQKSDILPLIVLQKTKFQAAYISRGRIQIQKIEKTQDQCLLSEPTSHIISGNDFLIIANWTENKKNSIKINHSDCDPLIRWDLTVYSLSVSHKQQQNT